MRLTALLAMAARVKVPPDYRYGTSRPWTVGAQRMNPPGKKRRKVFVEPIQPEEWSLFKGDTHRAEGGCTESRRASLFSFSATPAQSRGRPFREYKSLPFPFLFFLYSTSTEQREAVQRV
ncbi:UNVERIFIED_CONTAM: hypothetical protein FKN15_066124 [Acipenser sinensis]